MRKFELDELIEKIQGNINKFNGNSKYKNTYFLTFANGETIKICFPPSSVPHLLGVNTNYLEATGLYSGESVFELLNKMCADQDNLYKYIKNGIINEKLLFSDHIEKKNSAFAENLKINIFDMMFACPYDSSRSYTTGEENYKFDYVLVTKSPYDDKSIFMLGLAANIDKVDKSKRYVPMSNQYFESMEDAEEKFRSVFSNQELTIPVKLHCSGTGIDSRFALYEEKKFEKAREAQEVADMCSATLDVSEDYRYILTKKHVAMRSGGFINKDFSNVIQQHIKEGKIITPQSFQLQSFEGVNEYLRDIINAYNDFISLNSTVAINNNPTVLTYTDLQEEVDKLTTTRDALILANEELVSKIGILAEENEGLKKEVSNNEAAIIAAIEALTGTNKALTGTNKVLTKTK